MRQRAFTVPLLVSHLHMVLVYSAILHRPTSNHPYTQPQSHDPDRSLSTLASISANGTSCWPWIRPRPHTHLMFWSTPTTMTAVSPVLPTVYAAQQRDHASHIASDLPPTHHSTTRVLRTPLEFYTATAPNDPLAEDPYTYGTTVQPSSPRRLVYPRVSTETTLTALREANSPPPAHCTRSKSDEARAMKLTLQQRMVSSTIQQLFHNQSLPTRDIIS